MENIIIKDKDGVDTTFTVVRQPSGSQSAILYAQNSGAGMNRTAFPKLELSVRVVNGRSQPVCSVVVPYGAVVNGNFVKSGQVADTRSASQPADTPEDARANAEAFARNAAADTAVKALFSTGLL